MFLKRKRLEIGHFRRSPKTALGAGGRRFKFARPDQQNQADAAISGCPPNPAVVDLAGCGSPQWAPHGGGGLDIRNVEPELVAFLLVALPSLDYGAGPLQYLIDDRLGSVFTSAVKEFGTQPLRLISIPPRVALFQTRVAPI